MFIKSKNNRKKGFGNIMQTCSAKDYLGQKIKMTGYVKSENVEGWAGLWLRVDAMNRKRSLSFDNMSDRAIRGTTDWKKYEIILEVPDNSSTLNFGALLSGTGKIWFDNITFETVSSDTKATSVNLKKPTNTNFDE